MILNRDWFNTKGLSWPQSKPFLRLGYSDKVYYINGI